MASLKFVSAATGTTAAPTLSTDGKPLRGATALIDANFGEVNQALVNLEQNTGNDATATIFGYIPAESKWVSLGTITGELNPLVLTNLRHVTRIYGQITSMGTGTSIDAWIHASKVSIPEV